MERKFLLRWNFLLSPKKTFCQKQNRKLLAYLHALKKATSDLSWITTGEGHFLEEQSYNWEYFTGQRTVQAAGKGWWDVVHPNDREALTMVVAQCVQTGQPRDTVCLLRDTTGRYRLVLIRCIPVPGIVDDEPEVMYLGTSLLPNQGGTGKWSHRLGIEHLEAMLIDMAHDAILVNDPADGRILAWNQGAANLYGYSAEEAVGKRAYDLFQTRFPVSREEFRRILFRDDKWEGELGHVCRDGRLVTVEARFVLLRSEDGQPQAILEVSRDITERKRTEQQLKEYIRLVETAGEIGLWTWDIVQNKGVLSLPNMTYPGYEPGQIVTHEQFMQLIHPDDRERTEEAIQMTLEQKIDYINEFRALSGGSDILWYMAYGRLLYDEQGKPERMVGVTFDVTRLKRIEQELHEANEKVMSILENITDSFIYLDKEWRYIYVNSQACSFIGKSRDELLGRVFWDITPNVQNTMLEQKMYEAMNQRKAVTFDLFDDRTGAYFYVRAYPAKDGITVFGSNITERALMEKKLRKSEAKLRRLVEANITGVVVGNEQGQIIEANDAYLKMIGYTREELEQGKVNWNAYTLPEYRLADQRAVQELREVGVFHSYEKEYLTRQGRRVPVLIAGVAIEDEGDKHICFVVDLSKQKELEKQREHFLRLVSHELRTPLTVINGSLQLARRYLRPDRRHVEHLSASAQEAFDRVEKMLDQSLRQAEELNRLISDLVESARITTQKLSLALRPYDLVEIVRRTVQDQRFTVPEREIRLADLPASAWVRVDAGRIKQVLDNFITNALKYSPREQPVLVGLTLEGAQARAWVRDWGPGLSIEDQQRIWEPYVQNKEVQDQQVKSVNLGLGLYLCRLLVEQHGGQVGVESQPGQGATFWFTLPLST